MFCMILAKRVILERVELFLPSLQEPRWWGAFLSASNCNIYVYILLSNVPLLSVV